MAALPFKSNLSETVQALTDVIQATPRTEIKTSNQQYIHVVFTTKLMRFKDDVEFLIDPVNQVVHFRSASRVGHSDMGANKKRMAKFTADYTSWVAN